MGDNLVPNGLSSYFIDCFAIGPACGTEGEAFMAAWQNIVPPSRTRRAHRGRALCRRLEESRVSAAMDRSDNHKIVRQVETLDAEVRMLCAKLSPHAGFEVFGRVRITKDRLAFSEKPADLD